MKNKKLILLIPLLLFLSGCSVRGADSIVTPETMAETGFLNIWNDLVLLISYVMVISGKILGDNLVVGMILTTIIFRALLIPLYKKSIKSQQEMQVIQPELEKLKKKYPNPTKEQQQKMYSEQRALYSRHKINPAAGCLPLLIQMPLLFVFYDAIKNLFIYGESGALADFGADTMSTSFLFLGNMSESHILILAIATGITTFLATYVSMIGTNNGSDNPAAGMMKMMLYMMPVMIAFTSFSFPGALALYWMTGNLFSTFQTLYFKRDSIKTELTKNKILNK